MLTRNSDAASGFHNAPPSSVRAFLLEIICIFLALMVFTAAGLVAAVAQPRLVGLGDIRSGGLLLNSTTPGRYVEAPRLQTDIDVKITGLISRTTITQRFENPSQGWVEGIYVFPLPENAAVDTLKMQIGDRFIEGKIKERKEAKRIYDEAKRDGKKASLIEQERPNLFTNSIANIGPGEIIIVQIEYQETVARNKGVFSLAVPLVAAPRYVPNPVVQSVEFNSATGLGQVKISDPVPDRNRITPPVARPDEGLENPVTLTVSLDAGFAIDSTLSPSHQIAVKTISDTSAIISLGAGEIPANKDFVLTWQAAPGQAPSAALFRETVGDDEYLLAIVTPPRPAGDITGSFAKIPREIIFVIDNSGSMAGASMRQARQALLRALDRLTADDKFNIIRFDDTMEELFAQTRRGDRENRDLAKRFVRNLSADGGTEMLPALKAALDDASPEDTSTVRQVVFLTDGAIGNESQLFEEIVRNRGRSRIFTVGIGSAPNSFFMTRAAEYGRGSFTYIGSVSQVGERMGELFEKLENPVMRDLEAAWNGVEVSDVVPASLPDLYVGEPVMVAAKMKNLGGELVLSGALAGKPWRIILPLEKAVPGRGIGKLWARQKIRNLEGQRLSSQDWDSFDSQILQTALRHRLISRLTSLVAVDLVQSRSPSDELVSRDVPLELPQGWNFDKVFGPATQGLQKASLQQSNPEQARQFAQLLSSKPTRASAVKSRSRGIALPAGGTLADHKIVMGLLILLLAFTGLLVTFFWQHLARSYAHTKIARPSYDL